MEDKNWILLIALLFPPLALIAAGWFIRRETPRKKWRDRDIAYSAIRRTRSKIYDLEVNLGFQPAIEFMVSREKLHDRISKKIGLSNEAQFGNQELDDQLFILSKANEQVEKFFACPQVQEAFATLFSGSVKEISVRQGRIDVAFLHAQDLNLDEILAPIWMLMDRLADLVGFRSVKQGTSWTPLSFERFLSVLIRRSSLGVFLIFWIASAVFRTMDRWEPLQYAILVCAVPASAFLIWIAALLRGRSYAHRSLLKASFVLLGLCPALVAAVMHSVNFFWDYSIPSEEFARVIEVREPIPIFSPQRAYLVHPVGFHRAEANEKWIASSRIDSDSSVPSGLIFVRTRAGALGFPWVLSISVNK